MVLRTTPLYKWVFAVAPFENQSHSIFKMASLE